MNETDVESMLKAAKGKLDVRDPVAGRALLERASALRPKDLNVLMLLTLACRMQGDHRAALSTLDAALKVDPFSYITHLSRGAALDDLGERRAAAEAYKVALANAPPKSQVPPALQASLQHAGHAVRREADRLHAFLQAAVAAERAQHPAGALKRFDECVAIFSGRARRHVHECESLYFPQLPAIPYYDDALFPWLPRLEQATDTIRAELLVVLREDWGDFHPYVQHPEGAPVRQWKELNHSAAWSVFDLWRDGKKMEANCRRCPKTTELLAGLPMAAQESHGPSAMFSVLAPRTRIPSHTGSSNLRLITHLPLILPPGCRFRVGNETREWRLGKAWVFDDTLEHEAWNDSDDTRVILIFDVWNPLITEAERALVSSMMLAMRQYR